MKKVQVGVTKATEKPPTVSREYHDHMVNGLQGTIDELKRRLERQARSIGSLHDKIKMVHTLLDINAHYYEIHNNSISWNDHLEDIHDDLPLGLADTKKD